MTPRPPAGELTAYLDDGCDLCTRAGRRLTRLDRHHRVRIRPLAEGAESFLPQDLVRELHAVDSQGQVFRGYDALVAIAARVPALAWLSPLLGWAPVRTIGSRGYRLLAGRRHTCRHGVRSAR